MALEGLVNEIGPLAETFPKLDPNTTQHTLEITNDRRTVEDETKKRELRTTWFWTADSELYRVEDGEVVLYDGDRDTNLIFKNINEATRQLSQNADYRPSRDDIQMVLDSVKTGKTVRIVLSKLDLKRVRGNESRYFQIDTHDYKGERLNDEQRKFAERKYGSVEIKKDGKTDEEYSEFGENMKMLKDARIAATSIYVLNPGYVNKHVEKDGAIVRASRLLNFYCKSVLLANDRYIGEAYSALRGVPLVDEPTLRK